MRSIIWPIILIAAPAIAHPVSLAVPIDPQILFGASGPRSLPADHVLRAHVAVAPIAGAPDKIGKFLLPITNARELNEGLSESLAHSGMLDEAAGKPVFRLVPTWEAFDAPSKISFSSRASVTIHYRLERIDTGAVVFARSITTASESRGGDASDRLKGVARLAILTNFASAIACLDHAAYGTAPIECALKPPVTYRAATPPTVMIIRR